MTDAPYSGPPQASPPPRGWKVPEVVVPLPPRKLPDQDHAAVIAADRRARVVTQGMAILAASLMFVVLIVALVR